MSTMSDMARTMRSGSLEAQLHEGYDPNFEHKEQSSLFSTVQFGQDQHTPVPVLQEILNGVSNLFFGNTDIDEYQNIAEGNDNAGDMLGNISVQSHAPDAIDEGPAQLTGSFGNAGIGGDGGYVSAHEGQGIGDSAIDSAQSLPSPSSSSNTPTDPPDDGDPMLSAPNVTTQPVSGDEDQPVNLVISVTTDPNPAVITTVQISGVPLGAILSAGINNGNGTWTLTIAQLTGLTLTPPNGFSGGLGLVVTAISTLSGLTRSDSEGLSVLIDAVASTPNLSVQNASGDEDAAIPLDITASLVDTDGSETLSIVISNVPLGATLSAGINNGGGTWTLTPAQLAGLTITPPPGSDADFTLTVTAISSENGTTAPVSQNLAVTVNGVASPPTLDVQPASGDEDTPIPLDITAGLTDNDGSETLSIVISDVPPGAVLSAGIDNGDGTWTLTPAQLIGLTITPPSGSDADFTLTVTAISSENGTTSEVSEPLLVSIGGVANTPTLSVQAASGDEGTPIPLDIDAALTDNDGSETLSIIIGNVPSGAVLSAGIDNGDGTWTLTPAQLVGLTITPPPGSDADFTLSVTAIASENGTTAQATQNLSVSVDGIATAPSLSVEPASGAEDTPIPLDIDAALVDNDGSETLSIVISNVPPGAILSAGIDNGDGTWTLTPAQLTGLTITPPPGSGDDFDLTVTAISSENGTTAQVSETLSVTVGDVANEPILNVTANVTGNEDTAIGLTISAVLVDNDGSETLSVIISNVPDGATLSAGVFSGNGVWSLTAADLAGLTITPPENYSGVMNLQVSAVSTETNGDTAVVNSAINVTVQGVADVAVMELQAATADEDQQIFLDINAALTDLDGSETLTVTISGMPAGAALSAGVNNGGGVWTLAAADLAGLYMTTSTNNADDFVLNVAVTAVEADGDVSTQNGTIAVTVNAVADIPTVFATNTSGLINTPIAVNIGGAVTDLDGSESISFVVQGVPDGFSFNQGINNGDNSWTFTASQLIGLQMISPYDFQGRVNLIAQAVSHEAEGDTELSAPAAFRVDIGDVANGIEINLNLGIGIGGIGVGLGVNVGLNLSGLLDPGGLVVMEGGTVEVSDSAGLLTAVLGLVSYLTFSGVPLDATFNKGVNQGGGVWRMSVADLTDLELTVGANSSTDFTLVFQAHLLTLVTLTLATTPVHVIGEADVPNLIVNNIIGSEGAASYALGITASLNDLDGSETLSVVVKDLPAGFRLSAGIDNGNGTWSLTPAQLAGLSVIAPENYSGNTTFTVIAVATEQEGDSNIKEVTANINIIAAADVPVIEHTVFYGTEDQAVLLDMGIAPGDMDGSESITNVLISGLPTGATLINATDNGNGTWSANLAQLGNVQFVPPNDWHGQANLSVTVISQETSNGAQNSTTTGVTVHVAAEADTPTLSVQDSSGTWDVPIDIDISAALTDLDGSEHLSIVIDNVPAGAVLSAGIHNGNGTWTLTADDLDNLTIAPPANFNGDISLSVTAYSYESSNGDSESSTTLAINVHVDDPPAMAMMGMFMMLSFDNGGDDLMAVSQNEADADQFAAFVADAGTGGMPVEQDHGQAFHDQGQVTG